MLQMVINFETKMTVENSEGSSLRAFIQRLWCFVVV